MNQSNATPVFDMPADVTFVDDLDVSLDPQEYKDPAPPMPLMAGTYGVRLSQAGLKRVKDAQGAPTQQLVLLKNSRDEAVYPVIEVKQITVVTPEDVPEGVQKVAGKTAFPFQEFPTKPTKKKDFNRGGELYDYNALSAIIRSHDATLGYRGIDEGITLLKSLIADGAVFHVQVDWKAEDRKWIGARVREIDAQEKAGELTADEAKKQRNEVRYKQGQLEGIAKFKDAEGNLVAEWIGPSGEAIPARPFIREWVSTLQIGKPYRLGPRKV